MMVVIGLGPFVVVFWVVFVVLVIFSTIRLFFPPFNDDLGTMPTRRPYSWKKRLVGPQAFLACSMGMLGW